jgi:hypothetical protein
MLLLCGVVALASSACGAHNPQKRAALTISPPTGLVQPNVQIVVLRDAFGHELVDVTYPMVVPKTQAERDVAAIIQAANVHENDLDITNSALPLAGAKSDIMTSATFETDGVVPEGATGFRLEPWIVALRSYPNVAITYLMPPEFVFKGLRTFQDSNVQIALDRKGQSYTYHIRVLDSNFNQLNLPMTQTDLNATTYAQVHDRRTSTLRIAGLIVLSAVAAGAGYAVYVLLSRLH